MSAGPAVVMSGKPPAHGQVDAGIHNSGIYAGRPYL